MVHALSSLIRIFLFLFYLINSDFLTLCLAQKQSKHLIKLLTSICLEIIKIYVVKH